MAATGMLGLVASFGLMAASAPARARVQGPPAHAGAHSLAPAALVQRLSAASIRAELNAVGLAPDAPVLGCGQ